MTYNKCFVCGSDKVESESGYTQCKQCGFHTQLSYKDLSIDYKENPITPFDKFATNFPNIVQDLMMFDEVNNLYWLPIILDIYPVGIIYPIGTSVNDWTWCYAPYKVIPLSERKEYPIKGRTNEYHEYMLDVENEFRSKEFEEVLSKMK
jgi:hypothetical protein